MEKSNQAKSQLLQEVIKINVNFTKPIQIQKSAKSLQMNHPLNLVSEKLFEDSVNKLFNFKQKTQDYPTGDKSFIEPAFEFLKLKDDGSIGQDECIQFDLTNKLYQTLTFNELISDGW